MTTMAHVKTILLAAAVTLAGCGGGKAPAAPPPFRPQAIAKPPPPPAPKEKTDCDPASAADAKPFMPYEQRKMAIEEAQKLAKEGIGLLNSAKVAGIEKSAEEQFMTDAVEQFITALLADPYNVDATYNLSAAYARIDRVQCSINLLERLLQMRTHPSKKVSVESKLDKLLGRNKNPLDEDFDEMRSDTRFRELIQRAGAPAP